MRSSCAGREALEWETVHFLSVLGFPSVQESTLTYDDLRKHSCTITVPLLLSATPENGGKTVSL